jgi:hypothetical protein
MFRFDNHTHAMQLSSQQMEVGLNTHSYAPSHSGLVGDKLPTCFFFVLLHDGTKIITCNPQPPHPQISGFAFSTFNGGNIFNRLASPNAQNKLSKVSTCPVQPIYFALFMLSCIDSPKAAPSP